MRVEEMVGRRIRDIRDRQGMTQEQLGQAIGELLGKPWPRQTVSSAEAGRRSFTAAELVAIAQALRIYVGSLFTPPESGIELSPGVELTYEDVAGLRQDAIPAHLAEELDPDAIDMEIAETRTRLMEIQQQFAETQARLVDLEEEQSKAKERLTELAATTGYLGAAAQMLEWRKADALKAAEGSG